MLYPHQQVQTDSASLGVVSCAPGLFQHRQMLRNPPVQHQGKRWSDCFSFWATQKDAPLPCRNARVARYIG